MGRSLMLLCFLAAASGQEVKPRPPYFNYKARQMLIEGSCNIIPSKPIEVGRERQLLMDGFIVSDSWGCRRTVHRPEKYAGNPVMRGKTGTGGPGGQGTIVYDLAIKRFRLWTQVWNIARDKYDLGQVQAYYESEDGIHWTAPELGLVEFEGTRANNIIRGGQGCIYSAPSVIPAPPRLAARGKFIMLYGFAREKNLPGETHTLEQRIAWSNDGIHWQDQRENPVIRGRSDTFNNIVYNPERDLFMMYRFATVNSNQVRIQAYSESRDLVSWTQPEVILFPDELDPPMFHGLTVRKYQGVYLGLLSMFYQWLEPPFADEPGPKPKLLQLDVQLAWSRDGQLWQRHPQRPSFLANGGPGSCDAGTIMPYSGLVEQADKILIYYRCDPVLPRLPLLKKATAVSLCLATLRRDGFVSVDAAKDGYLLTKPLQIPGGRLHINAQTEPGGFIRVALRRGDGVNDGDWLDGWTYEQQQEFHGDATDAVLAWKSGDILDSLKGRSLRLHFWLNRARIFSFWFE